MDNLQRFATSTAGLTFAQQQSATNHLLGGISAHVPPEKWDAAVERALAFVNRCQDCGAPGKPMSYAPGGDLTRQTIRVMCEVCAR